MTDFGTPELNPEAEFKRLRAVERKYQIACDLIASFCGMARRFAQTLQELEELKLKHGEKLE